VIRPGAAAALLAALALLAGCATAPRPAPELAGRLSLSVKAHDTAPAHGLSAQFELRGDAHAGELQLTTALGTLAGWARWGPGSAELITGQGTRRFPDLDALALDLLGEALPLTAVIDWLHGRAWPGAASVATAEGFVQLDWRIDLSRLAEGWVVATRERAPAVALRVKLDLAP